MSVTSLGPKPNIIVFDQEAPPMRPCTSQGQLGRTPDVLSALGDLNKRILKIQIYEQVLRDKAHSLQSKGTSSTINSIPNQTHDQILNVLERKLHILILESNKTLQDLKDEIERVMTKEMMNKKVNDYQIKSTSNKLEKMYLDKIKEMQITHSEEILKLERRNQAIQKSFQQRIQRIQSKLVQKIKELERREQSYKSEIQKIKNQSLDNRRFEQLEIELQQTKIALKNLPQKVMKQGGQTNRIDGFDKDTTHSRMRRNRIFEKKQQEMPSAMVSPIRNHYSQVNSVNLLTRQLEDLTSELNINFNPNNHQEGSDQDVFFYPESSKVHMVSEMQASTKIFSPFDINNKY